MPRRARKARASLLALSGATAAAPRAEVLRRLPASSQVQVSGADHFFNDREDQLVQSVRRFLDRVIER